MQSFSQKIKTEELHWQEKSKLTQSLYDSMENFVNFELSKKKRDKDYNVQKRIEQRKTKIFLETHFILNDTILELVFFAKNQILEWKGDYHPNQLRKEEFRIKNANIFILIVDGCFGIYCPHIYVFKEIEGIWILLTSTSARLMEMIMVKVVDNEEKIVFETKSSKIGELSFEALLNSN
jgi:hypothetical protein